MFLHECCRSSCKTSLLLKLFITVMLMPCTIFWFSFSDVLVKKKRELVGCLFTWFLPKCTNFFFSSTIYYLVCYFCILLSDYLHGTGPSCAVLKGQKPFFNTERIFFSLNTKMTLRLVLDLISPGSWHQFNCLQN